MARPISWQSELSSIHRRVSESPRTPYHREDLEKLFRVGPRAAGQLLELMPRFRMANALVVEREALLDFLGGAVDAEDLGTYMQQLRKDPPSVTRRKLRMTVPRDFQPGDHRTLDPESISLWRCELGIRFTTLDDLASKLYQLMRVMESPDFERRFCDRPLPQEPTVEEVAQQRDTRRLHLELQALHKLSSLREALRRRDLLCKETVDWNTLQLIAVELSKEASLAIRAVNENCGKCVPPEILREFSKLHLVLLEPQGKQSSCPPHSGNVDS